MKQNKLNNFEIIIILLSILELIIFLFFFSFFISPVNSYANTTVRVTTLLDVGNVYPEVLNVSINEGATDLILIPGNYTIVSCVAILRDYNNDSDIRNVTARFYHTTDSSYNGVDDNNTHYSNNSCKINFSFGNWNGMQDDNYTALSNCTFNVWYYANWSYWNCTVYVNDSLGWSATGNDTININQLLAVGLPATINYGTVNATYVSNENATNVTNAGNVRVNLSLSGYAQTEGDGKAMNCTRGSLGYINVTYEKYNLTKSNISDLSLAQFSTLYINLTEIPTVKRFELNPRFNDAYDEAFNTTYWRIFVPVGVAGSCQGNIIFGATTAQGT